MKQSMETLLKSSEHCGPIKKKSYHHVSGILGMSRDPLFNEDICDCYFDGEQAVLLRFKFSRISTIKTIISQQVKLGLVLGKKDDCTFNTEN